MKVAGVVAGFALTGLSSQAFALPADLAQAAKLYDRAQVSGNRGELSRLLADDYVLVSSRGRVETKAQFIRESTDPQFRLNPFKVVDPVERVWGNAAVLGGSVILSGVDHGGKFQAHLRFADVWAKRNGRWQVIYTHVSKA